MYLAIIILPLLASVGSGFFGRKIGVSGAQLINTLCIMTITILSFIVFFEVGFNNTPVFLSLFKWIDSETLNVFWGFTFDSLTVSMLIPVLTVSSLVHLYSIGYMSHDPHNQRFFSYLSLFTFMMVILVTANNFLLMFVGWEGVGICSYLLVSFWFTRIAANQSSMSAILTNRVGDCFLTIGIFILLWSFGNIDYSTVFSLSPFINENIITLIGICLLIGAMAKSSQVGLHIWLPQAMEGPTPVSALIHAATMVTAGVYLLMRSSPLIEYSSTVLLLCLWVGAITTVFSSLVGLFQQDIKKVIAYSTMSQLGIMIVAIGLSSYNVALFHLVNHAFYKALLFLGAGSVIHAVGDNQDFRKYGALRPFLPLTYSIMLIASLSLIAFPFMTGFYSKDFILESAFGQYSFSSIIVYVISTIGAVFTTLYSVKVLYLTFLANPAGSLNQYKTTHESEIYMSLPLILLALLSIFFGFLTKDAFIGLGTHFYNDNGIFIHPNKEIMINTEFAVPIIVKLLPFFLTIFFSLLAVYLSEIYVILIVLFKYSKTGYKLFSFFNQRFYVELFYNNYILETILNLGSQTTKILDKGSVELIGPFGLEKLFIFLSNKLANLDTGVITRYALFVLISLISYILIPYIGNNSIIIIFIFGLLTLSFLKNINNLYLSLSNFNNFNTLKSIPFFNFNWVKFLFIWIFNLIKNNALHAIVTFWVVFTSFGSLRILSNNLLGLMFSTWGLIILILLVYMTSVVSTLVIKNLKKSEYFNYYEIFLIRPLISITIFISITYFVRKVSNNPEEFITFINLFVSTWVADSFIKVSLYLFPDRLGGNTYAMAGDHPGGRRIGRFPTSHGKRPRLTSGSGGGASEQANEKAKQQPSEKATEQPRKKSKQQANDKSTEQAKKKAGEQTKKKASQQALDKANELKNKPIIKPFKSWIFYITAEDVVADPEKYSATDVKRAQAQVNAKKARAEAKNSEYGVPRGFPQTASKELANLFENKTKEQESLYKYIRQDKKMEHIEWVVTSENPEYLSRYNPDYQKELYQRNAAEWRYNIHKYWPSWDHTPDKPTTAEPTTAEPTTAEPTKAEPTKAEPTKAEPTTGKGKKNKGKKDK